MPGHIEFRFDKKNEILVAVVHWDIATEDDVRAWAQEWLDYLGKNFEGRRVDFVVVLDEMKVSAAVGPLWGKHRAQINKAYGRFSYRVHPSATARMFTQTSGVLYNAATAEAPSIDAAIEGIKQARDQLAAGLLPDVPA